MESISNRNDDNNVNDDSGNKTIDGNINDSNNGQNNNANTVNDEALVRQEYHRFDAESPPSEKKEKKGSVKYAF